MSSQSSSSFSSSFSSDPPHHDKKEQPMTIERCIQGFFSLPPIFRLQLKQVAESFKDDEDVKARVESILHQCKDVHKVVLPGGQHELNKKDVKQMIFCWCLFLETSPMRMGTSNWLSELPCYDLQSGRPVIQLDNLMKQHSQMMLFSGTLLDPRHYSQAAAAAGADNHRHHHHQRHHPHHQQHHHRGSGKAPLMVKLYISRECRSTAYEVEIYKKLGEPSPYVPLECAWWGVPVLVMKQLQPLDRSDNEFEVGKQILIQLYKLFKFTVHSDLKPENIMKEPGSHKKNETPTYRMIDFGGCARDRLDHGWRRRTWTKEWTSQPRRKNTVTTCKNDLIELCYVLNYLRQRRKGLKHSHPHPRDDTGGSSHRLRRFMKYVQALDDRECGTKGLSAAHRDALIAILSETKKKDSKRHRHHHHVKEHVHKADKTHDQKKSTHKPRKHKTQAHDGSGGSGSSSSSSCSCQCNCGAGD